MLDGQSDQDLDTPDERPIPWRLIAAGVIALAVIIFIFQNTKEKPTLRFLWIDITLPLWLLFVILVGVGMAIDRLIIWRTHRSRE